MDTQAFRFGGEATRRRELLVAALVLGGADEARRIARDLTRETLPASERLRLADAAREARSPGPVLAEIGRWSSAVRGPMRIAYRTCGPCEGEILVDALGLTDLVQIEGAAALALDLACVRGDIVASLASPGKPSRVRVTWTRG